MVRSIVGKLYKKGNKGTCRLILLALCCTTAVFSQNTQFKLTKNISIEGNPEKKDKYNINGVTVYDLDYKSFDNIRVKGFLICPKDSVSKKWPVVIYNRGGNGSYGMVGEPLLIRFLARIAAKGYIVIGSQLRGSEGSEGIDEWGGKDIEDVMALFSIIKELKSADTSKIAQIGWSRGGVTNFQLLKKTDKIKTTVNIAGPSDLLKTDRPIMFEVYKNRIRNYEKDSVFYTNRVSPLYQLDSIKNKKSSIFYIHGDKDTAVKIENSKELYRATQKRGIKTKMETIPDADHSLRQQFEFVVGKIDEWLTEELNK